MLRCFVDAVLARRTLTLKKQRRSSLFCNVDDRLFETNASGVLDELYESDQAMSHELLVTTLKSWGQQSSLFAAADTAKQLEFMEHDCCQTKLNKIWFGKITTDTKMWQVG